MNRFTTEEEVLQAGYTAKELSRAREAYETSKDKNFFTTANKEQQLRHLNIARHFIYQESRHCHTCD